MKSLATAFLCVLFVSLSYSSTPEKFSRVRINVPDHATLSQIWSTGIDYEGVTGKIGGAMEFVVGQYEIEQLTQRGISYQVVVDDLAAEYERSGSAGPHNALGFGVGSMGGHYTYAEALRQLDTMKLQYPNLITTRDSIGRSQEGRGMWIVKISDNPNINEPSEPEVLYTGLHHAREPMGLMSCLYFMWWLLENYGTNPEATYLVNNRQMWFLPVVNPDGYVYNQTTNPNGGGMWRKNRRNNGGSYGVDLNRNYGPYYMWNSQIVPGGSSTDPASDTYRGPSPFSEPEDTTIDRFMRAHNVKACLNYHTYGNYLIYPYGYLARENSDSLIYRDWAYYMTADNRYTNGTDMQTVAYATRGGSDDYMFGDTTKPRTFAMTPEVGTSGFYAALAEILPLAIGNLSMNQYLAHISGQYANLARFVVQDAGGNGFMDRGESFSILSTIKNKGVGDASNLSYTISSNSPSVQFGTPTAQIGSLASQAEALIVFSGSVSWNATTGVPVQFFLTATDPEGFLRIDTLKLYVGTPTAVFADSASSGTANWTTGTGWGVTSNAHTPPSAFTDSPTGNYAASANNSLTLVTALNLASYNYAQLKFWTKWAIEPTWDFATAEVSTNNGSTWTTLRTSLSHKGSARSGSQQPAGSWGYDSYTPFGQQFLEQDADLTPFRGSQVKIRFRMAADGGDQRDGFYVDDIRVHGYTTNQLPDTGVIVLPSSFTFTGVTGRVYRDSIKINNYTPSSVQVSVAETTATFADRPSLTPKTGKMDVQALIKKLRPAFEKANLTRESFQNSREVLSDDPDAYTTLITDERNENGLGAADIFGVQYQYRTNIIGSFHDFKIVMAVPPDTNIVVVLSLDTDQDFGTGSFPTPLGIGSTTRDIGSEFEVLLDASGVLIDSLTPLGRIPAGIAFSTANDTTTLVGIPFLLTIQRDSVLTIGTESSLGGINAGWLNDPDRKMNIGFVATRLSQGASPMPDFAPGIGHGLVGTETGVSWLSENRTSVTIPSGDSAFVRVSAVGAKLPGTYNATLKLIPTGRPTVNIPVQLNVTALAQPHIVLNATNYRDTVRVGDSTMHTLNISNTGNADLIWGIMDTSNTAWATAVPAFGSIPVGQSAPSLVTFRSAGLTPNTTYTSRFLILSNDQATGSIVFPISLRVTPPVDVNEKEKPIPTAFALRQNYPNPFNPETNISFDLPKNTFVTLTVFNLLGQEVGTLVSGQLPAGTHNYMVGGKKFGLTSGVYFYRLSADDFVQTRKMVLLR